MAGQGLFSKTELESLMVEQEGGDDHEEHDEPHVVWFRLSLDSNTEATHNQTFKYNTSRMVIHSATFQT